MRMSAHRRLLALVLLVALAVPPVAFARRACADEPAGGTGGAGSTIQQVNKGFALLFMVLKLAEWLGTVDLPPQSGPPDPQWGWHPDPLPGVTPPADAPMADPPLYAPVPG